MIDLSYVVKKGIGAGKTVSERFWEKVQVRDPEECWPWTGTTRDGYGLVSIAGRSHQASRVAYELVKGPIPDGFHVLHSCDNPPCVNPRHLSAGTRSDNMRDKVRKGRDNRSQGEAHYHTKLSAADVAEIRRLHDVERLTIRKIAALYGMSVGGIKKIAYRSSWKSVQD